MSNAPYMRETERNLNIWQRYKDGERKSVIARDVGLSHTRVSQIIRVFKIRQESEE